MRHQGAVAEGLRGAGTGARLFRQLRSVRRLRSDLRRGQAEPQDYRDADSLQGAHLRRNPDFPVSGRMAAVEDGVVRVSQTQGHLTGQASKAATRNLAPRQRLQALEGQAL